MYQCPVCNTESKSILCSCCGFDFSCDYSTYPTAARLPVSSVSISRQRAAYLTNQQDRFHCTQCGSSTFIITQPDHHIQCARCGQLHGVAQFTQCFSEDDLVDVTARFAGKTIHMRSVQNGKYLCVEAYISNAPLMANRDVAYEWETFTVSKMTVDGWVAIQTYFGKYLNTVYYTINTLICSEGEYPYTYRHFRIYQNSRGLYLKSNINDLWLSVRVDMCRDAPVYLCGASPSDYERLEIEIVD